MKKLLDTGSALVLARCRMSGMASTQSSKATAQITSRVLVSHKSG